MVSSHVSSGRVPSVEEGNLGERVLLTPSQCSPRVHLGCTLDEAFGGGGGGGSMQAGQLGELVRLYRGERYLLTWHSGASWVLVLEGAQRTDLLRAMWQAAWLERQHERLQPGSSWSGHGGTASSAGLLADSLAALQEHWPDFVRQAEQQGWQLHKAVLPQGSARLRLE